MYETIENCFRSLILALQMAKLYGTDHVKFVKALDKAYEGFQDVFKERDELVFGIIGDEVAFEKEVMFGLSKIARPTILYLKSREVERMDFYRSMEKEELRQLLLYLLLPREEIKKKPPEYFMSVGIKNINISRIKGALGVAKVAEAMDYLTLYSSSLENFNFFQDNILEGKDIDYHALRFNVAGLFENLLGRSSELLKLTVVKRYDPITFAHIINVSILSMFLASKIGLPKDDILEIGISAVFHDSGKVYLSRKIINKTGDLSEEEFEVIKGHTVLGSEILLKYVDTLGMLPVLAAFEHHLKSDLKGYPQMNFPQKPHLSSAIIRVCDVYDALLSRRSYKAAFPPNFAYDILMKEKENFYSPELVDYFFRAIGVWPVGSLVVLTDSRIAVVREENEDDIFFPMVEVLAPEGNKDIIDLKQRKTELKIEKFLDPLSEGKPYVSLI